MTPKLAGPRREPLQEGTCFRATRVECHRVAGEYVTVMAEEVHAVINPAKEGIFLSTALTDFDGGTLHKKHRASYETRKVMTASSFKITVPDTYLGLHKTPIGTTIVDVKSMSKGTAYFPPMSLSDRQIYRETSAVKVILGLDPSVGRPWVSPMAFRHIKSVWKAITRAGGIFVADFDTSESGWARFRSVYICPAPAMIMYVLEWKVQQSAFDCCGQHRVVPPLLLTGGMLYTDSFQPSETELADPVLFKSLGAILGL